MLSIISITADILGIISAIVTVISAIAIRKYYQKIVKQYNVEKLTLSEQHIHQAIEDSQLLKKLYNANNRGLSINRLSDLYSSIEAKLNLIVFELPASFEEILNATCDAKKLIQEATKQSCISTKSSYFEELCVQLDALNLSIKKEKENIQQENMK